MMSVDKFNSVGGFSVGIPPKPIIDAGGNITALSANIAGNVTANSISAGDSTFANITALDIHARNLYGAIHANLVAGDLQVDAADTEVVFSEERVVDSETVRIARGSPNFTFNKDTSELSVVGNINIQKINLGTPNTGKVVYEALAAKTFDASTQVLHNIADGQGVETVEYTVIATRTLAGVQLMRHACKIVAVVLDGDIRYYEYGTAVLGGVIGDFKMQFFDNGIGGKFIQLTVDPAYSTGEVDYKIFSTIYKT
jgi:hypothetical protein